MRYYLSILLLMFFLCFLPHCKTGPKVRVYLSDPAKGGMEFYDQNTDVGGFVNYAETNKFICFTPGDMQTLLNYCGTPAEASKK